MPLPAAALPAAYTYGSYLAVSTKHVAVHVATSENVYAVSSATLAYLLTKLAWKNVPDWIKEDVAVKNLLTRTNAKDENTIVSNSDHSELSNLSSVIEKLQALVVSGNQKLLAYDIQPVPYLHASLFLYIQLVAQFHQRFPMERNQWYEKSGIPTKKLADSVHQSKHTPKQSTAKSNNNDNNSYEAVDSNNCNPMDDDIPFTIQQILDFAIWAYEADENTLQNWLNRHGNLRLIQHQTIPQRVKPGYVGHFVAVCDELHVVVIGIKGTSTVEDILTDCCGRAVTYNSNLDTYGNAQEDSCVEVRAEQPPIIQFTTTTSISHDSHKPIIQFGTTMSNTDDNYSQPNVKSNTDDFRDDEMVAIEVEIGHERIWVEEHTHDNDDETDGHKIRCHEGILISTKRLANKVQKFVEQYVIRDGYQLILCGHSLGAGAACLLGTILHARLPELHSATSSLSSSTATTSSTALSHSSILRTRQKLRVYAFAPPPVLDYDSAIASSSYITSYVNNSDIIPRSSLSNLIVFLEFLRTISTRIDELGLTPTNPSRTASFLYKLSKGSSQCDDDELIMSYDEVQSAMNTAIQKLELRHPDHLYIPGRVRIMYEHWQQSIHNDNTARNPAVCNCACKCELSDDTDGSNNTNCMKARKNYEVDESRNNDQNNRQNNRIVNDTSIVRCIVTDGAADVLRFFELDSFRFATDHTTASYEANIHKLLLQQQLQQQ